MFAIRAALSSDIIDHCRRRGLAAARTNSPAIKVSNAKQCGEQFVAQNNASVSPYHNRMPFILRAEQLGAWPGDDWLSILENPDRALLEKIQKQPELF